MTFNELENEEVALIAAFDKNGRLRLVIDPETYCEIGATVVEKNVFETVPPPDTFKRGPVGPLILRKIEPFQILVYEFPSVNSGGSRRRTIHVQGSLVPHPDD